MSTFSFSFSGDDIEEDSPNPTAEIEERKHVAESGTLQRPSPSVSSAFPISGQPLLPPKLCSPTDLLATLPSKIAYSTLRIKLDDGSEVKIPRRELWDVRVQLMAEDEGSGEGMVGLGKDDVKTGVYEGGFKSWESSVDVVRVLASRPEHWAFGGKLLELGCGTALPTLAVLQWVLKNRDEGAEGKGLSLGLADYNPSVLQLVTLPNLMLSWAQVTRTEGWEEEGELEIDEDLIDAFLASLRNVNLTLSFFSGAWGPELVKLVGENMGSVSSQITIIGAETIYSPFALKSFAETLLGLMASMDGGKKTALVAAKKVYFGVGGSMEDFCEMVRAKGALVGQIREESDGVRRAVVEVKMTGS
jgi:protein-histidine N-methyltransferase